MVYSTGEKPVYEEKGSQLTGGSVDNGVDVVRKSIDPEKTKLSIPLQATAVSALRGINDSGPIYYNYLEWDTPISDIIPHAAHPSLRHDKPPHQIPQEYYNYNDPYTFSKTEKGVLTAICSISSIMAAWSSAGYSMGIPAMMEEWHVAKEPLLGGLAIFTAGFASAPMILAPVSEIYGRRYVLLSTYFIMLVFILASALAPSATAILIFRFPLGVGASSFSSILGGMIADTHHSDSRGLPMCIFAMAGLVGTGVGPLVSGYVVHYMDWRWIHWVQLVINGVLFVIMWLALKETRGGVLLHRRSQILNRWLDDLEKDGEIESIIRVRWKAKSAEDRSSLRTMIKISLTRPFILLFTEPVVFWFSLWISFCWSMLYLFLNSVQIVFGRIRGLNQAQIGEAFIPMIIGGVIAAPIDTTLFKLILRKFPTHLPERRLYAVCILGPLMPLGMLFFGLTSPATLPSILPTIAIGVTTIGIYGIYLASFNYLADTYNESSSSALAAQSFCRNMIGGAFPLIGGEMFNSLGVEKGSVVLCGIGLALCAVPWVLVKWGGVVRARSKYATKIAGEHPEG